MRWWRRAAVVGVVLSLATAAAHAQEDQRRIERAIRQATPGDTSMRGGTALSISERAMLDVGGLYTFTYLSLDDSESNNRTLRQYDTSVFGRLSIDGVHNAFVRAKFRYRDFSPGDSFDDRGDTWAEPFLDRYWYEFDLRNHVAAYEGRDMESDLNVRIGRQFVDWGAGLVLSEQLYAARVAAMWGRNWSVDGIAGVTPGDRSIIDFDNSREDFDEDTKRGFFGGLLRYTAATGEQIYFYGLSLQDYNEDTAARFGTSAPVDFGYEASYFGFGFSGAMWGDLLYLGEAVYETGTSQSDPLRGAQKGENISAYAARAQLTYLLRDVGESQAQVEVLVASGDADRQIPSATVGGNLRGTQDDAFNSLGFANTGLAFAPSLSNIVSIRMGVSTFPLAKLDSFRRLQTGVDVLLFSKFNHAAPMDEPTHDASFLGSELDVYANYRLTSDLAVNLRYGVFWPGKAIAGEHDPRDFFMVAVTLSF